MTPLRRALAIVGEEPGIAPARFAKRMWPDSPGWQHHARCGPKGSHRGGGMYRAAGGYLGKLRRAGLVERDWPRGFRITQAGLRALTRSEP